MIMISMFLYGDFEIHPKYGQQFKLDIMRIVLAKMNLMKSLSIYLVRYLKELVKR